MSQENENPQEDGQDLYESMSEYYNAGEDEESVTEEVEETEVETEESEELEETAETDELPEDDAEELQEEAEELEPLQPHDLWTPEEKEMFGTLPREVQEAWLQTTANWQKGYTEKFQALADERRQLEPITQTFQDPVLSNYLNMQGWQPHQAVQVLGQHIRNILTDPKAGYSTLMQAFGHDPTQIFSQDDEQYTDPALQQVNQRLDQYEREKALEQQRYESEQVELARQEILKFANQESEPGKLAHPRFDELREQMMQITNAMPNLSLEQVYRMAESQNPQPAQDPVSVSQAVSPQKIRRTQAAKKTVKSKQSTKAKPTGKQSIDQSLKALYHGAGE